MIIIKNIGLSLLRWFLGLNVGCLLGLLIVAFGQLRKSNFKWFDRILDFLRAIPLIGLVPIIQMNIGVHEYGKIGLIAWGVMFPIWLTVLSVVRKDFLDTNLMLSAAQIKKYSHSKIYFWPKIIGGLFNGIDLGIGIAWLCVVAAEWVGTYTKGFWSGGLGYGLLIEYNNNNWIMVHIYLIIFGILGILSSFTWSLLKKLILNNFNGFDPVRWLHKG